MLQIRTAEVEDAMQLAEAIRSAEQSGMMLFGPGERKISEQAAKKMIGVFQLAERSNLFVAQLHNEIVGYLIVKGEEPARIAHRGYVVIGIKEGCRGQGIGTALFQAALDWAKTNGLRKLELTVIKTNDAAVKLYEKVGFEVEGVKKNSLCIDGKFVDEYLMGIVF